MSPPTQPEADLYSLLGTNRSATPEEIKRAYRKRARETHPDYQPEEAKPAAAEEFKRVKNAYDVLRDPHERKLYDAKLDRRPSAAERAGFAESMRQQASNGSQSQGSSGSSASTSSKGAGPSRPAGSPPGSAAPPRPPTGPPPSPIGTSPGGTPPIRPSASPWSPKHVAWIGLAVTTTIGVAVGALIGGAHPGNHLPTDPFFVPFVILELVTAPTSAYAIVSTVGSSQRWSMKAWGLGLAVVLLIAYMLGILLSHGGHFPSTTSG